MTDDLPHRLSECAVHLQDYVNRMQDEELNAYLREATGLMFKASERIRNSFTMNTVPPEHMQHYMQ